MAYIIRRLGITIPVLIVVSILTFMLIEMIPGDPARLIAGSQATAEEVDTIRRDLGLDQGVLPRYFDFLRGIVDPTQARSLYTGRPVTVEITSRLPNTLTLAFGGLIVGVVLGVLSGVVSALKRGTWLEGAITVLTMAGLSMPIFWFGLLAIWYISVNLGWFPASGAGSWRHFVLPILVISTRPMALISRLMSSSMVEVMGEDYLDAARSKGLGEFIVIGKHALRNSLIPTLSVTGVQLGALLGGSVITETVFGIPGVGRLLVSAILQNDYPIIQYTILILAVFFTLVNLLVDLTYSIVDPRIRLS